MKKIAILILSLFLSNGINTFGAIKYKGPDETEETKIKISIDGEPNLHPRSVVPQPSITAELFADQLAFYFDDPVGEVVVTVTNSCGQVVSACTCNTDFEPMTILIVPTDPDFYRIELEAAGFKGYGEYSRN